MQACNEIIGVQCQSVTSSVIDRCVACLQTDGNHFAQYINYNNYKTIITIIFSNKYNNFL